MVTEEEMQMREPKLPGNYGGETLREYCGKSRQRRLGRFRFEEPGVSAQDLYRAIGKHTRVRKVRT